MSPTSTGSEGNCATLIAIQGADQGDLDRQVERRQAVDGRCPTDDADQGPAVTIQAVSGTVETESVRGLKTTEHTIEVLTAVGGACLTKPLAKVTYAAIVGSSSSSSSTLDKAEFALREGPIATAVGPFLCGSGRVQSAMTGWVPALRILLR